MKDAIKISGLKKSYGSKLVLEASIFKSNKEKYLLCSE